MFLNLLTYKKGETTKYFGWILYTSFLFFDECSSLKWFKRDGVHVSSWTIVQILTS